MFSFFCDCYAFSNHVKWVCIYFVIGCYISGAVFTLLLVVTSVELTLCYDSICTEAVVTFDTLAVSVKVSMS